MRRTGRFPCETGDCILGASQTCKFFQARSTNNKGVFIAAPVKLQPLVDMVKDVCAELGLEATFAVDKREYNRFAFCHNICHPMLESSTVVIIGDWDGNAGNANVAFEYGIATALGCEIVPIRVEGKKGGPFDMAALHSIILGDGWDRPARLRACRKAVKDSLVRIRDKIELGRLSEDLPRGIKTNVRELTKEFEAFSDLAKQKTIISMLRKIWQMDNRVLRDPDFVTWALSVVKLNGKGKRLQHLSDSLDPLFFEMLEAMVSHSFYVSPNLIAEDRQFISTLGRIARGRHSPIYARKSALESLTNMASQLGKPELLKPLFDLVTDVRLGEEYAQLQIESKLKRYLVDAAARGWSLTYLLDRIDEIKRDYRTVVLDRVKLIETEVQKP